MNLTGELERNRERYGVVKWAMGQFENLHVVPPGNEAAWSHPPFAGATAGDRLYGRGAVDMKGGIACFVAAALDYLAANGGRTNASVKTKADCSVQEVASTRKATSPNKPTVSTCRA